MKHFDASAIKQGQANQAASAETPEAFGTMDGAVVPREGPELSSANRRMAGQVGARALAMMNNPQEQARTEGWMARFGMSNQGMQWNQAKMMMTQPQQPQEPQE